MNEIIDARLQLTSACNLRCKHCLASTDSNTPSASEMSTPEVMKVVDNLCKQGLKKLVITGGEPLIREHDVFTILKAFSNVVDISLYTNGLYLNSQLIKNLADVGLNEIQVSIDGPEKLHEAIRGKDTFFKSLTNLKLCNDSGINTSMRTTINAINYANMSDVIQLYNDADFAFLKVRGMIPVGRGENNGLLPTREQIAEATSVLAEAQQSGLNIKFHHPSFAFVYGAKSDPPCNACRGLVGISATGEVSPCNSFSMVLGNVRNDSIDDIIKSSNYNYVKLEKLNDSKCLECEFLKQCGGGCRAVPINTYNWSYKDPMCPL